MSQPKPSRPSSTASSPAGLRARISGRRTPWLPALAAVVLTLATIYGWAGAGADERTAAEVEAAATPPAGQPAAEPLREVIVLVDLSAGAGSAALDAARSAAEAALDALGRRDLFNVLAFGERTRALYPASWPATAESRDKGRRFLAALEPLGERSLLPAVEVALAPAASGYGTARVVGERLALPRRVLLLTSRPVEDAAALAPVERRLPPTTRLDLIPTGPAASELVRSMLDRPDVSVDVSVPAASPESVQAVGVVAPQETATGGLTATPESGPGRVLLLLALALPVFLLVLGWAVRRGLATGPVSG